ncbi:hypothetical protein C5167_011696 [Papaver somniferum]|uniref:Uncharacterized protein n=1 Tax=Papaver somniferum TaxID=3469 RepID=A0A4Y7K594_PAPSO|nr:hypothetical protein C5167_011696 [Papaver somniferum]
MIIPYGSTFMPLTPLAKLAQEWVAVHGIGVDDEGIANKPWEHLAKLWKGTVEFITPTRYMVQPLIPPT